MSREHASTALLRRESDCADSFGYQWRGGIPIRWALAALLVLVVGAGALTVAGTGMFWPVFWLFAAGVPTSLFLVHRIRSLPYARSGNGVPCLQGAGIGFICLAVANSMLLFDAGHFETAGPTAEAVRVATDSGHFGGRMALLLPVSVYTAASILLQQEVPFLVAVSPLAVLLRILAWLPMVMLGAGLLSQWRGPAESAG